MNSRANGKMVVAMAVLLALPLVLFPSRPSIAYPNVDWGSEGVQVSQSGATSENMVADGLGGAFFNWYEPDTNRFLLKRLLPDGTTAPGWDCIEVPPASRMVKDCGGGVWLLSVSHSNSRVTLIRHYRPDSTIDPNVQEGKVLIDVESMTNETGFMEDEYGGIYFAWNDDDYRSVYCIRFDRNWNLSPGWPAEGMVVATGAATGEERVLGGIAGDAVGGVMVGWADEEDDYYVQRVGTDGNIHQGWGVKGKPFVVSEIPDFASRALWFKADGEGGLVAQWREYYIFSSGHPPVMKEAYIEHAAKMDRDGNVLWDKYLAGPLVSTFGSGGAGGGSTRLSDCYGGGYFGWWGGDDYPTNVVTHLDRNGDAVPGWPRSGDEFAGSQYSDMEGGTYFVDDSRWYRVDYGGETHAGWPEDGGYFGYYSSKTMASERSFVLSKNYYGNIYAQRITDIVDPPNFNTYILLENPNDQPAEVTLTFMVQGGLTRSVPRIIPPHSRDTVNVNDQTPYKSVSTRVESNAPIICERSMYFDYGGTYRGGHDCTGVTTPGNTWYLAEGYTAGGFDTYLLLQNPGEATADVTVTYMLPSATAAGSSGTVVKTYQLPPHSRYTVTVDSTPGLEATELSMKIEANEPVIAERAMYFDYGGRTGGHDQAAIPSPSTTWHLPEGYTAGGFDTYLLVQNPGEAPATVNYTYMTDEGAVVTRQEKIDPHSRYTVNVDKIEELSSNEFSTTVTSDEPVIAERAMYFEYGSVDGGHDSVGATSPAPSWYLAEGYTAGGFDTYVLILNPEDTTATVKATYMLPTGVPIVETYDIPPNSRYTVEVDKIPGLEATEVSTRLEVTSGAGIVAERAIYFTYGNNWTGGHDTIGVTAPSDTWYFAEGCTGY